MNEGIKTLIYAGVAAVVTILAIFSRPPVERFNVREQVEKLLFEKFDDPAKAGSMEIVKYDETLGTLEEFRVARDKTTGAWTLPKYQGYPADAESRVRDAALLLVDLPILGIASEVSGDHRMFGVVQPDKEKLKVGDEGVGLLVRFEDTKGQDLASLIIGKKVSGAEGHRFVRKVGQDVVYEVKIDPDQLSTKFKDWIEKDLLKMNAWDAENVALKNYTVSLQPPNRVLVDKKFDLTADFKDSEWKLKELKKYVKGEGVATALGEHEELNKDKLNDLKTAVDELEIADVRRKPKGLGADLKAGAGMAKDDEGMVDLMKHGFYMVPMSSGETELLSANGEITVGMKDGVEYVLRFGETEESGDIAEGEGENRYLFVTTRVDMSKFPQPELEAVPELPGGPQPEAAEERKAEAPKVVSPGAKESKPEPKSDAKAEAKPEPEPKAKPETKPETSSGTAKPSASDDTATAEAAKSQAKPDAEAKPETEAKPAAGKGDAKDAKTETPAKTDKEAKEAEIERERERITKENQRKIDERNEKLKKAKEKVAELNTRFGDWYYLVSDKQFKKIQLGLDDVIKKKEIKAGEGDSVDDFRTLQKEGLKKD